MNTPKYILFQEVLEWCNLIRKQKDKEPLNELPKGVQKDGNSCPCGKATGVYVGCTGYAETQNAYNFDFERRKQIPDAVREFVPRFDDGEFPELIDDTIRN
jgi:hypothetical protein